MAINLDTASISEIREELVSVRLSSVDLVRHALARVAEHNSTLKAVVVEMPDAMQRAAEADQRYAAGTNRPLEGIPFTVKDSYLVRGLTAASGSPAFVDLTAGWNAFTVETLLQAGAILLGKTNMPPMADGGMQRGVYDRSESPFNSAYLPAAYASGSSHGSAVAVATGMGMFGMGEETVSSGRSPASNNGIVAYTPSRGILSMRGNWPLFPTRDVAVPHARTVADLLELLNVLVVDDHEVSGDFWREQRAVALPSPSQIRPADYRSLPSGDALQGRRFAVPRRYLGRDPGHPVSVHPDVLQLWQQTRAMLEAAGAEVIETDFPLAEQYEAHTPGFDAYAQLPGVHPLWAEQEFTTLVAVAWDNFLRSTGDPRFPRLASIDRFSIFPPARGQLPDRYTEVADNNDRYAAVFAELLRFPEANSADGPQIRASDLIPEFDAALLNLEHLRETLLEDWLREHSYDAVVFPANADIGRANADSDPEAAEHTWRDGTLYSNGNFFIRHLGIPTVTTSMGMMRSTGMPVAVTFAGAAYSDSALLSFAHAFETARGPRPLPFT